MIALCILLNDGSTRTVRVRLQPGDDALARWPEIVRCVRAEDRTLIPPPEDEDLRVDPVRTPRIELDTTDGTPANILPADAAQNAAASQ